MTFIAALRCDRIEAPRVIDGPINGESFAAYVEQVLVPTLKEGDIVVLENDGSCPPTFTTVRYHIESQRDFQ